MAKNKTTDPILEELIAIKKLLIHALYRMNFLSGKIIKARKSKDEE